MDGRLMRTMRIEATTSLASNPEPLTPADVPIPVPHAHELRIRVLACGVCHTEIDEIEGRTPPSGLPRIPGHQVVGMVDAVGHAVRDVRLGTRVGVGWIAHACGRCAFCGDGRENLCADFRATGRDTDGGYAGYMVADASFVHPIPDSLKSIDAAPLLCAGAIGVRSLRMTGLRDGEPLGLTGFGASGHLMLQFARNMYPRSAVYVFARNERERAFARELGATWAGDTDDRPPQQLSAVVDTTPAWRPIVRALAALAPGGRLVINAIRKTDSDKTILAEVNYAEHLWREKAIVTVANVTRDDIRSCLALAAAGGLRPTVTSYPLEAANAALVDLANGEVHGAKVLSML